MNIINLTEEQYDKKIEELKVSAKEKGYNLEVYVSKDYINKRSSLWHGGAIARFIQNKNPDFCIDIDAFGDVCIDIDGETFKDKSNGGRIGGELSSAGYINDQQLYEAIDNETLYLDANNWYEISGNYKNCFIDLMYTSDYDDYLETIQEVIDHIKSIEESIIEEIE